MSRWRKNAARPRWFRRCPSEYLCGSAWSRPRRVAHSPGEGGAAPPAESPYWVAMDPSRKRQTRLVVALTSAVLLAVALIYTSFSAASEARQPSQLGGRRAGQDLPAHGPRGRGQLGAQGDGAHLPSRGSQGRRARRRGPLRGPGARPVPRGPRDPDRRQAGRRGFEGQPDSLVTKCPSKFTAEPKT